MHFPACAEHTSGHMTSGGVISGHDPVTLLPVAPPHSTTSNAMLAVLIYYSGQTASASGQQHFETFSQPTISLEMPVPSQGHYGFHNFPVVY